MVDSRARHLAHGGRSEDVGTQPVSTIARREESPGGGWKQPRQRLLPESDVDHHGAVLAILRSSGGGAQKGEHLMEQHSRRELLRLAAGAVAVAPLAAQPAPRFFTPTEFRMVDELSEIIIPADDHSPGARAAQVAAYIHQTLADSFDENPRHDF